VVIDPLTNNTCVLPSGDTTGATDTANINGALGANLDGQNVVLAAGHFYVNSTITIPPGGVLRGQFANEVNAPSESSYHPWGSVITAVPTAPATAPSPFNPATTPGGNIYAVVACVGQQAGGYANPGDESKVYGLMIDCSQVPPSRDLTKAPNTDGLQIFGGISRSHLQRVLIAGPPGHGFNMMNDGFGNGPDAAHLDRVNVRKAGGDGFHHMRISDCTYYDCLAENCTSSGFYVENGSNGVWTNCRAEHNIVNGYYYTCSSVGHGSGVARFVGCSSDRNGAHGIYITTNAPSPTSAAPTNALPLVLSGCTFRRDGTQGATTAQALDLYGGISISHYPGPVQISGCTVWPGVGDSGGDPLSPYYGMRLIQNTSTTNTGQVISMGQVIVGASYIQGADEFLHDDGTTEARWGADVTGALGPTDGPTIRGPRMNKDSLANGSHGSLAVECSCVNSGSIIMLTRAGSGSGILSVTAIAAGTSFTVTSSDASDTSDFYWQIMNP
jgi:hypothetical protein